MKKGKYEYPRRKVIYSKLKPGTNGMWFSLLECGHFDFHGWHKNPPKMKQCNGCAWGTITIDLVFWDWNAIRWGHKTKTRPMMEYKENGKISKSV